MSKPHLHFQNFGVLFHWLRTLESHPIWQEAQNTTQMLKDLDCHSTCSTPVGAKQYAILLFIVRLQIYTFLIKKRKWRFIFRTGHMKRGSMALRQSWVLFWTFSKFVRFISLQLFGNRFCFHFHALKGRGTLFCKTLWKFPCLFLKRVYRILPFLVHLKKKLETFCEIFHYRENSRLQTIFKVYSNVFYITSFNHFCR
jgi:hypothetical protein